MLFYHRLTQLLTNFSFGDLWCQTHTHDHKHKPGASWGALPCVLPSSGSQRFRGSREDCWLNFFFKQYLFGVVSPSSTVRTFYTEMTSFRPCACQCQTCRETKGVSAPCPRPHAWLLGTAEQMFCELQQKSNLKQKGGSFLKLNKKQNNAQLSKVFKGLGEHAECPQRSAGHSPAPRRPTRLSYVEKPET